MLSAGAAGATPALSSYFDGWPGSNAVDLCLNPIESQGGCSYSHSNLAVSSWFEVTFPGGLPSAVSWVYFFNRVTTGCGAGTLACEYRVVGANVTLVAPAGNIVRFSPPLTQSAITTYRAAPFAGPFFPDASSPAQLNETARQTKVRFVEVRAAAGRCLAFRECMVLDSNWTNVALGKPVIGSLQTNADGVGAYSLEMGNDGEFSFDSNFGNMVNTAVCDGAGFWRVDLGGIYDLTRVVVFNRYSVVNTALSTALSGATVRYLNFYGVQIGSTTLTANAVQTLIPALVPPSPSPSNTPSWTATVTNTPTLTGTATGSLTSTMTGTASMSFGASQSPTVTVTPTLTGTATVTPTATQTGTPLSQLPFRVRIQNFNWLHFSS